MLWYALSSSLTQTGSEGVSGSLPAKEYKTPDSPLLPCFELPLGSLTSLSALSDAAGTYVVTLYPAAIGCVRAVSEPEARVVVE